MKPGSRSGGLFDRGLQPERTALAWRRTTISLVVGAAVAVRILPPVLGMWSILAIVVGFGLAGTIGMLAGRRARAAYRSLLAGRPAPPAGGLLLILALTVGGGAVLGMIYVLAMVAVRR